MSDSCDPWTTVDMDPQTGFPVLHYLPEFPQICIHQSFPASESFQMSWLFPSGGERIGASASSISPSNEYPGLISFMIDWFDLLVVQGTLKSLLQHQNSKASIFQHWAFFMVQLSHPCMTTGQKPYLWFYESFLAKWCLYFLIHCLGLS